MEHESEESQVRGFSEVFDEVSRLLSEAQKNHGIANHNYTDYILEWMEIVRVHAANFSLDCMISRSIFQCLGS